MADQVILLRDGHIEQDATPEELYARPASMFTARFIGTPPMNVVTGAALAQASPAWAARLGTRAAEVAIGIRPEDVQLDGDGMPATVSAIEYLGADSVITCMLGDVVLAVRAKGKLRGAAGNSVRLAWDPAATHCFDRAGGQRLAERFA